MNTILRMTFVATGMALGGYALAQTTGGSSAPKQVAESPDATFVQKAGEGGIAEVELSRLAEKSAQSAEVRSFASHMVREHSRSNRELELIATKENISLPKELDPRHEALRDQLAGMDGPEFDRAYIEAMAEDHEKMDDLLKASAGTVTTDALRTYINKTTPVVEAHLRLAEKLKKE